MCRNTPRCINANKTWLLPAPPGLITKAPIQRKLVIFQADDVTPTKLTMMATDITNGLAYLAEMKFIHRYV